MKLDTGTYYVIPIEREKVEENESEDDAKKRNSK
jgi:hypothetical protein